MSIDRADAGPDEPARSAFSSRASDAADVAAIEEFIDEGMVELVLGVVKSGKKATVYRCQGGPLAQREMLAVKVYHESAHRAFQRSMEYEQGRYVASHSARHAIAARTELGRQLQLSFWVEHEFETLSRLGYAGADVPEVFTCTGRAILMELVSDGERAAPLLREADFARQQAKRVFERLSWNIELWLRENVVHGDLSPYNVLYSGGRVVAIDFPQAVDPRANPSARRLLGRDVRNVVRYFRRYGIEADEIAMADDLWRQFQYGWR